MAKGRGRHDLKRYPYCHDEDWDIGYGVIGDVAKKAREELNVLQGEIVEITLTDDPPKQVKEVRRVPETSAESAGLPQAATAA